ncbi:hypothetical protein KP803_15370 [Vibrio sp. ZSDE26]|uniref:Uncharacterized protein n=1 Tax=Vibrio amylolyticus TaxID=2847292 RepID=A0A9X1XNU5_9VIBR|nr:hypothetical protein [Vibrio amylolyticus]MCK6264658.1 hypothetical protein [Vibrio amylolyticus]
MDKQPQVTWWQAIFTKTVSRQLFWGVALTHALLMTIFVIDLVEKQQEFYISKVNSNRSLW